MEEEFVKDLVCGMEGPKSQFKYTFVYQGKTFYFCSEMDKQMFEKYPDRWIRPSHQATEDKSGGEKE
jgi:YHS domain-containing protein